MKTIGYLLIILLIAACGYTAEEKIFTAKTGPDYHPTRDTMTIKLSITQIDSVLRVIKPGEEYEFTDIYPLTIEYTSGTEDTVHIKKYLLERGYEITEPGYGNWEFGPRIFNLTATKGDSVFHLTKLYYTIDSVTLKRTETIQLGE